MTMPFIEEKSLSHAVDHILFSDNIETMPSSIKKENKFSYKGISQALQWL